MPDLVKNQNSDSLASPFHSGIDIGTAFEIMPSIESQSSLFVRSARDQIMFSIARAHQDFSNAVDRISAEHRCQNETNDVSDQVSFRNSKKRDRRLVLLACIEKKFVSV